MKTFGTLLGIIISTVSILSFFTLINGLYYGDIFDIRVSLGVLFLSIPTSIYILVKEREN
mgnify:CR=1 FL=1